MEEEGKNEIENRCSRPRGHQGWVRTRQEIGHMKKIGDFCLIFCARNNVDSRVNKN
jgi:hypothetical protein